MGICVCMGAMMQCTFGAAPATLITNMTPTVMTSSKPVATIMDNKPIANIPPFGMCSCPANPATVKPPPVVFAPAPCVPVIPAPWVPGSPTVIMGQYPALNNNSKLMCAYGGVISIVNPGQATVMVP